MGRPQCKTAAYSDYTLEQLLLFLGKRLDLDARLAILEHLDECDDCFEEVYRICKNQDASFGLRRNTSSLRLLTVRTGLKTASLHSTVCGGAVCLYRAS